MRPLHANHRIPLVFAGLLACQDGRAASSGPMMRDDLPVSPAHASGAAIRPAALLILGSDTSAAIAGTSTRSPALLLEQGAVVIGGAGGSLRRLEGRPGAPLAASRVGELSPLGDVELLQRLDTARIVAADSHIDSAVVVRLRDLGGATLIAAPGGRPGPATPMTTGLWATRTGTVLVEHELPTLTRRGVNAIALPVLTLVDGAGRTLRDSVLVHRPVVRIVFRTGRTRHASADPFARGPLIRSFAGGVVTAWSSVPVVQWRDDRAGVVRADTLSLPTLRVSETDVAGVTSAFPNAAVRDEFQAQLRTQSPEYWPVIADLRATDRALWVRVAQPYGVPEEWWVFRRGSGTARARLILGAGERLRDVGEDSALSLLPRDGGAAVRRIRFAPL